MSVIIEKYRKGFKFQCPISKTFYGPYFKTREAIEDFFNWYDADVRYIGTWLSGNKLWIELMEEWFQTESGTRYHNHVSLECIINERKSSVLNTVFLDNCKDILIDV